MAKLSNKTTTAGPTALTKALKWYDAEPGPIFFKNACAGYYKGMNDVRSALPGIFGEVLGTPGIIFQVNTLGGAIGDGPEGAYPHREYNYLGEQQAYWQSAAQAATRTAAIRRMQEYLSKAGINRHYANYPDLAFNNWPTAYYGAKNYARLQKLKQRFDPDNRIRHPQSVRLPE